MPQDDKQDKTKAPQERLEENIRVALLDGNVPAAQKLMQGGRFSESFRNEILGGVLNLGDHAGFVRFLVEDLETEVTGTRAVFLLNAASRQGFAGTAAYLAQKAIAEGIEPGDCYARIFSHFAPGPARDIALELAAEAPDREEALADMANAAALAKSYRTLNALLDAGAKPGRHLPVILIAVSMCEDQALYADKDAYLSLFGKTLAAAAPEHLYALDIMLPVVAYKVPEGLQYPEMIGMLLDAGADPYAMHAEARRFLVESFTGKKEYAEAARWQERFDMAQAAYTQASRHAFDALFGTDYRLADLRQTVNEEGDTGLTLAAKARRLDGVIDAAQQDGGAGLSFDDIAAENPRKQSVLSLAIDRGDLAALMRPAYWLPRQPDVLRKLEDTLSEDRRRWADLDGIAAQIDRYRLRQQAGKYKLGPRP